MVSTTFVFAAALATALATGLGALPFAFGRPIGERWIGVADALAAGVMIGASASLAVEGFGRSGLATAAGAAAGAVLLFAAHPLAARHDVGSLRGADAQRALLVVGVMTVHSFAEGIGVGSAFGGGAALGVVIAVAIAVHNIPEGLAISLVLVPSGVRVRTAAWWSIFSSLPQPLVAVPAFLFVEHARALLPAGLGFAAGAMTAMVARELLPDAVHRAPARAVYGTAVAAGIAMFAFQTLVLTI
jgi:zinc transporter, ZIP family